MARKEKDWEVGPVLKNKPDSQGTLFRGGTKYSSDARFPRHYTPERLAEIKDAMGSGAHPYYMRNEGTGPERRKMIDNLSRSTVPAQDIKGVDFSPGQFVGEDSGEAGAYHRHGFGNKQAPKVNPKISVAKGHADDSTVIHEIGHHVSAERGTGSYDTPSERGAEEGRADAYAFEHYRDRKGRAQAAQHRYLGAQWQHGDRPMDFHNAYEGQTSHIPDQAFVKGGMHDRASREEHPIQHTWNFKQGESGQPGLFDLADVRDGEYKFYDKPELHRE